MELEMKQVRKSFGEKEVLKGISFYAEGGKAFGLLGRNGAGKTTSIRILMNVFPPDSGEILFSDAQASGRHTQFGYLPEERGLYKKMKVGEQALFFARLKGLPKHDAEKRLRGWFEHFGISDWWNKKVNELSKGMAQKIQFIVTVLHEPKLLIFDEPFSGFDPVNAQLLKDEILRLRDLGATIVFSTHNMSSVEEICDRFTLINKSRNILSGSVEEVKRRFALGRYDFTIEGDTTALVPYLIPMVDEHEFSESHNGRTTLSVKLNAGATLRDAITAVNEHSVLLGVAEKLPTMNDIFIQSVTSGSTNQGREQQQ